MKNIDILKENGIDVDSSLDLLGDIEMYDETLNDFLEVSHERMPRLDDSKNNQDMKNYAVDVHAIKGDSKYLGFTKLAEIAYEHQMKSEELNTDYINEHYIELINEVNRIIDICQKYLNS